MKRYLYLLASFVAAAATSCAGFLEEVPESEFSEGSFYTDVESLRAGVVGAFSVTQSIYVVGTNTPLFIGMLGTDECMYPAETNLRGFLDRYTFTPTDGCIKEFWRRYYRMITACNTVIHKAAGVRGDRAAIDRCVGNARFLRAWAYFNLVQTFGAVPLMADHVTELTYDFGRAPVDEVYRLIEDDLRFCLREGVLPQTIDGGWANYWAAETLLAKVYITMASARRAGRVAGYERITQSDQTLYGDALALLQDVMDRSGRELELVYGDVFKIENKNVNRETIWEIQFSSEIPYGSQWSKEYGVRAVDYDSQKLYGGWRSNAVAGQCTLKYVPSFWFYYDADGYDVRRAWNLTDYIVKFDKKTNKPLSQNYFSTLAAKPPIGANDNSTTILYSGVTKYRWGKTWRDEHTDFVYSNCPNNVIVLRLADVLLMYAEADLALHGAPTEAGLAAMNRIVQRARGVDEAGEPIPAEQTPGLADYTEYGLEDILLERARELCFEHWRWYDLARTGMFEHFLADRNSYTLTRTWFDSDKHYLLPIPLSEIQLAENKEGMYQNPNYD